MKIDSETRLNQDIQDGEILDQSYEIVKKWMK